MSDPETFMVRSVTAIVAFDTCLAAMAKAMGTINAVPRGDWTAMATMLREIAKAADAVASSAMLAAETADEAKTYDRRGGT